MKKILAIISMVTGATLAYGQGTIVVSSISSAYLMYTNNAVYGGTGGTSGATATVGANTATGTGYYYQLLIQPYTGEGVVDNPSAAYGWYPAQIEGLMITNSTIIPGGIAGPGGPAGATVDNWGAPTGASASTGTEMYYILVGWSANLGSSWTTVANDMANNFWFVTVPICFGWSAVGYGYAGGGPDNVPAPSVFGVTAPEPGGFTSGFTMWATPIPEPSTIALAGLGGLFLLLFRRRKSI